MKRVALIMAGGSGERFWPLSRRKNPKQLLKLNSPEKTMIEESIERISSMIPQDDIFIITSEVLAEPMRRVLKSFPPENILPEPAKRNTAPCLALGVAAVLAKYGKQGIAANEISIAVLTADQSIYPEIDFVETVEAAMTYAESNHALVTIGIVPDRPETGYGYVEIENQLSSEKIAEVAPVLSFREKPHLSAAQEYVDSGRFLWNSGMFFWRADTFIAELNKHLPEVGNKVSSMAECLLDAISLSNDSLSDFVGEVFSACPNISIDFGLMEKSEHVAVAKALFSWDDVGAWDALRRTRPSDESGNIISGDVSLVGTKNSIVINESEGKIISSVIGMDNVAVIITHDAVLVCPIDKVQDVKKSVDDIRNRYSDDKWL